MHSADDEFRDLRNTILPHEEAPISFALAEIDLLPRIAHSTNKRL